MSVDVLESTKIKLLMKIGQKVVIINDLWFIIKKFCHYKQNCHPV